MAANGVTCSDCHETKSDYPGTVSHYGTYRLIAPTPAKCQACHAAEVAQFEQSRHSIPAYVAVNGTVGLNSQVMAAYQAIPEGSFTPNKSEHPLAALEGDTLTPFACNSCHSIGQPNADNSVGRCQACHLTHSFNLAQSRKPETCNACHIGPDHPQFEIYQESAHGIRYATDGQNWNWNALAGTLTIKDMPAPTCSVCHMSAFGSVAGTHDVGNRLTNFLFAEISSARPDAAANQARMQAVCLQCHAVDFVSNIYSGAGQVNTTVNGLMQQADAIMADLQAKGLLTAAPFDEPIDFVYFDTWHDFGRTTKFCAWMNGPDYSQWHGAYEILRSLVELKDLAAAKIAKGK
jgi:hydroxylamine dehydrogenase